MNDTCNIYWKQNNSVSYFSVILSFVITRFADIQPQPRLLFTLTGFPFQSGGSMTGIDYVEIPDGQQLSLHCKGLL